MNVKRILLITIIAVAILASVSVVSAGLFDGLFGEEQQDNVNELENITFNTTNVTDFKFMDNYSENGNERYFSDKEKITIAIIDYNQLDDANSVNKQKSDIKSSPTQLIDDVVIYTGSANGGKYVGETRYFAIIENIDLNKDVIISSPSPNETAKMALSLKFK